MQQMRLLAIGLATLGFGSLTTAQVTGPTPLAWRWVGQATRPPVGSPMIQGETVYVAVGSRISAVDRSTGNRRWQFPPIDPIDGTFNGNLLFHEGTIYAAASNKFVYALDPATGAIKWQVETPGQVVGKLAIAGNLLVLNIDANSFTALSLENGTPAFANPERVFEGIKGDIFTIGTSIYYFTSGGSLFQTNVSTRRAVRISRFQGLPANLTPIVVGANIVVVSGTFMTMISGGGTPRFNRNLNDVLVYGVASNGRNLLTLSDSGKAFVTDMNGNPSTRRIGGTRTENLVIDLGSTPVAGATAVGDLFAVPTANGAMNLVDPVKGEVVWVYTIRPVTSTPTGAGAAPAVAGAVTRGNEVVSIQAAGPAAYAGNSLYVLAADGSLLAFDPTNGVDLTGPGARLIFPQAGSQVGTQKGPLDIFVNLSDDASGINEKTIKVTVNGNAVSDFTYGRDGVLFLRFGRDSKNGILPNGRAAVAITVSDWMGNEAVHTFSFTIDNDLAPLARPGGTTPPGGPGRGGPGRGGFGGGRNDG